MCGCVRTSDLPHDVEGTFVELSTIFFVRILYTFLVAPDRVEYQVTVHDIKAEV